MNPETPFLSILAPAYNEEMNIERVILLWEDMIFRDRLDAEIIIVNDGSTDQTGQILDRLEARLENLKVISFERNRGPGAALRAAVAQASGLYSITIDSDGQFDLEDYKPLLNMLQNNKLDAVTGRRAEKKDTLPLVAADRILNILVRILFSVPFKDTNCALKIYRTEVLRDLPLKGDGWSVPTELLIRAHKSGARIGEMSVRHYPRPAGESKLHPLKVAIRFFSFLVYLRIELAFMRRGKIQPREGMKNDR